MICQQKCWKAYWKLLIRYRLLSLSIKNLSVEQPPFAVRVQSIGKNIGVGMGDTIVRKYQYQHNFYKVSLTTLTDIDCSIWKYQMH
jgi:hypothetical protein